jgi:Winged helix DNA-binding domain
MKASDIRLWRLRTQRVTGPARRRFGSVHEAVSFMGAVQSQDYLAAKWAVGQRVRSCTDATFDEAFSRGEILRTHVLRPTWHFVSPADLRWMLALSAPHVNALLAYHSRQQGLDRRLFARSNLAIAQALQGGNHLTRDELGEVLGGANIGGSLVRRTHILLNAELEGVVCSGPLRGKLHTYALLDERVPRGARLPTRDEALAALAGRFFLSHGPATLRDYVWWSGLTVADAKAGVETATPRLAREIVAGTTYFFEDRDVPRLRDDGAMHLLPNFDEYLVAYVDRDALLDPRHRSKLTTRDNVLFQNVIVHDGRVVGTWRRTLKKDTVSVATDLLIRFGAAERQALAAAIARYARFLGRKVEPALPRRRSSVITASREGPSRSPRDVPRRPWG